MNKEKRREALSQGPSISAGGITIHHADVSSLLFSFRYNTA
jgi:hypothetical protein